MIGTLFIIVVALAIMGSIAYVSVLLFRKLFMQNTNNENTSQAKPLNMNETLTKRSIIVAVIALVMIIPLSMMNGVVSERNFLYQDVLADIANTWGGQQLLQGPVLVVPFVEEYTKEEKTTDDDGKERVKTTTKYVTQHAVMLPKHLSIDVSLAEQHRKRGVYNSLVYQADIAMTGSFERLDIENMSDNIYRIDWNKAYVALGLSDTRAINHVSDLKWNDTEHSFSPGTQLTQILSHGFHAKLAALDGSQEQYDFAIAMSVNGSQGFRFSPFGETTTVNMQSSWPHPSFQGSVLPSSHKVENNGFTANWVVPHLARSFPQTWVSSHSEYDLNEFVAGVDLFEPVFLYSKIIRAVKYGILFVGLTFLTFLIFELTTKTRLHFVQYGLIGIALSLFYLLLLSVAEHTTFLTAYIVAAATNVGLITAYTAAAIRAGAKTVIIFSLLSALYIVLYSLLQLEDYALLMGALLLLSVLMVLMYVTRNLRVDTN